MSNFINVTIAKESDEELEQDTPMTINTHYIIKISSTHEDEAGNAAIALATGEFLFVTESYEELGKMVKGE